MNEQEWHKSADLSAMIAYVGPAFTLRKQRLLAAACCRRLHEQLSDPRAWAGVEFLERAADEKLKKADWLAIREQIAEVVKAAQQQEVAESLRVNAAREAYRQADRDAESHEYGAFRLYETASEEMSCIVSHLRAQATSRAVAALAGLLGEEPDLAALLGELAAAVGLVRRANAWLGPRADLEQAAEAEASRGHRKSRHNRALRISRAAQTIQNAIEQAQEHAGAVEERGIRDEKKHQCALLRDLIGDPFAEKPAVKPSWLRSKRSAVKKLAQTIYQQRSFNQLFALANALEEAGCAEPALLNYCRHPGEHARGCWVLDLLLGKE